MNGIYNGVAANILRKSKNAHFVHCNAHCLDLALQDLTKDSVVIDRALSIIKDIVQFVRKSAK
jgi:ubiquinone/menaquinone biosynthesis C-methylase UbiE